MVRATPERTAPAAAGGRPAKATAPEILRITIPWTVEPFLAERSLGREAELPEPPWARSAGV